MENILQRLAGVPIGVILDVLPRQAIPVINLPFAAPIFDPAFQAQGGGIVRLHLQNFLQLLQRERILFFVKPGARGIEQLRKRFSPDRAIELTAQRANGSVHV
ncbi:MAG: hypothetical protein WCC95_18780, partial [Candidatus Sulfotelmatobacter sp.]